jgi:hypothetical protein
MATYTVCEIYWGSESGQNAKVRPTGEDYSTVEITYPNAAAPYFRAVLTKSLGASTVIVDSQNLTVIRPG